MSKHLLINKPTIYEELADPFPHTLVFGDYALDLLAGDHTALDEQITYTFTVVALFQLNRSHVTVPFLILAPPVA